MKGIQFLQDYWILLLLLWIIGDYMMDIVKLILKHKSMKREIKHLKKIIAEDNN